MINTSPNQKVITVKKTVVEKGSGAKRPYLVAYRDEIAKAAQDLTGGAFKLYIYLLGNDYDFTFGFSPKDLSETFGISENTARDALKLLIEKKYLTLEEGKKAHYLFTSAPNDIEDVSELFTDTTAIETRVFVIRGKYHTFDFNKWQEVCHRNGIDDEELIMKKWEAGRIV